MSEQVQFFRKNLVDLDVDNITITVTDTTASNDGQEFVDYMRNRKNDSAWITTGSDDAADTELDINLADEIEITDILLVGHNLKYFNVQYWTGVAWSDFSTPISETVNTETTNHYVFDSINSSKLRIQIFGTHEADADKYIKQLIVTRKIGGGQLEGWPQIKKPQISTSKKSSKMLSGKVNVIESINSYSATLSVKNWNIDSDLDIVEEIYFKHQGVLVWICGGDEDQFSTKRIGYTKEDIYLVRPTNEYTPELYKGIYSSGIKVDLKIAEAIN